MSLSQPSRTILVEPVRIAATAPAPAKPAPRADAPSPPGQAAAKS